MIGGIASATIVLQWIEHAVIAKFVPLLYAKSEYCSVVPRSYGFVLLFNIVIPTLVLGYLGCKVSKAREQFKEQAKKDGGEADEALFAYPNMYVPGNSETANKFNSIQRGHQQALETIAQFMCMSLVGGIESPLCVAFGGIAFCIGRLAYAHTYAKDTNPSKWYVCLFT